MSALKPWSRGAEPVRELHEDHDDEQHDQRDGDPFDPEQRARRQADVARGDHGDAGARDESDDEPLGIRPDADPGEERLAEEPDLGRRSRREREVGAEERPPGEEPGAGPERHARERVHRPRVAEALRQPDERVRHEHDAHGRRDERQRHRLPDERGGHSAVERHGRGRRHDRDRQRDRLPEVQLAAQAAGPPLVVRRRRRRALLESKSHVRMATSDASTGPPPRHSRAKPCGRSRASDSPGRYSRSAASISAGASAESAARSTRMPTRRP
jgi:hypothetical protein